MIQGVRERLPDAELVAFSSRPEDTEARHGIRSFPIRSGGRPPGTSSGRPQGNASPPTAATRTEQVKALVKRVPPIHAALLGARRASETLRSLMAESAFWVARYRRLRGLDLLIVAGSNQLSDYVGGPWGFPYTIFAWSVAARVMGVQLAFLSVGAGPIRAPLSRSFIRAALRRASFCSLRDTGSRDAVASLGLAGPHRIAPDLAHGLRLAASTPGAHPAGDRRTVAINPLPYFDPRFWAESDRAVYEQYVEQLALFVDGLLKRGDRVQLVPTQLRADPPVISDVLQALDRRTRSGRPRAVPLDPPVKTFDDLVRALAGADLVVATRFHGVVLAQLLEKPTIGVAYRRSTTDLLVDMGQGKYAMDIADVTSEGLGRMLEELAADAGAAGRIAARVRQYREILAAQYDELLGVRAAATGADAVSRVSAEPPASC